MRFKLCLAALAAATALATPATAQQATASANATARGVVLLPLTLTRTSDLDFGTVVASPSAGTVAISADDGSRSVTGGVTGVPSFPGGRAVFQGAGSASQQVVLTLNAATFLTSGANTIPVNSMTFDSGAPSVPNGSGNLTTTRTINGTGAFAIGVGGNFGIAANQANGLYTGTFSVTADYQ